MLLLISNVSRLYGSGEAARLLEFLSNAFVEFSTVPLGYVSFKYLMSMTSLIAFSSVTCCPLLRLPSLRASHARVCGVLLHVQRSRALQWLNFV
uniref:Uncharacterized protein n=1 Tax=Parascaris univalens TaxID=6257 RepID=A0A915BQP0_PARUN